MVENLNKRDHIWVQPGEGLEAVYDFGDLDASGYTIALELKERRWSAGRTHRDMLGMQSFPDGDAIFDTADLSDGTLRLTLDHTTLSPWEGRTMEGQLYATPSGGVRQAVATFLLTVNQGA